MNTATVQFELSEASEHLQKLVADLRAGRIQAAMMPDLAFSWLTFSTTFAELGTAKTRHQSSTQRFRRQSSSVYRTPFPIFLASGLLESLL